MKRLFFLGVCLLVVCLFMVMSELIAQTKVDPDAHLYPKPTPAALRMKSMRQKLTDKERSIFKNINLRNIGPTIMSGRVVDLDVSPQDPTHFYVAFASGGLWQTTSNGTDFTPLFQNQHSITIGDIAVDWKDGGKTLWLGSGENNSSRSSYAGTGVYKSADSGKSWQWMGLRDSHHIGRIVLHPTDPNTVWVAALGHLYSPNEERGVFKTIDGGKTWNKQLFVDKNTGAVDLVIDPSNPEVLYAAVWHRWRKSWHFEGSGKKSGIYKTTDGGKTWNKLPIKGSSFPNTKGIGRIGLAVSKSHPDVLYAILDNQDLRSSSEIKQQSILSKKQLRTMSSKAFLRLKDEDIDDFLNVYHFPKQYHAQNIKEKVRNKEFKPNALVTFLEDANALLFDTPVKGAELYRSDNGGKTWYKTHEGYIDDTFYSYGYYFGQVRISPKNPDKVYVLGVPLLCSEDKGKTWKSIGRKNVHADHHALYINPQNPDHLINGNDGGINISYNDGATWNKANHIPVGQFYDINIDASEPYYVYGGLQDNGVWYGRKTYKRDFAWHQEGRYPYQNLMGGDGMQTEIDTRDNKTIYTGWQFGNYYKIDRDTEESQRITPQHELGDRPFRFNWQTPIHLSRHNQDVLYMGSSKFHRSLDRGETFQTLSRDLTRGGKKGNVAYSTLTVIEESPLQFGLIYTGTDDGNIHLSKDVGVSWKKVSGKFPDYLWVSRIKASNHKRERVYATLNGYRWDHFAPYLYVSENMGKTWKRIGGNLPQEPINAIEEDFKNPNIIYIGTDNGLYISLDRGDHFDVVGGFNFPNVPVHDLALHRKDRELVIGTHGRSIFIADVSQVQQMTPSILKKKLHLFPIDSLAWSSKWGKTWSKWFPSNPDPLNIAFYSRKATPLTVKISLKGNTVLSKEIKADRGLNYFTYDLTLSKAVAKEIIPKKSAADNGLFYAPAGKYRVDLTAGKTSQTSYFTLIEEKKKNGRRTQEVLSEEVQEGEPSK